MKLSIIYPSRAHSGYKIAADVFASLAEKISGYSSEIITDDEYLSCGTHRELVVLIGNDAVNNVTANFYLQKKLDSFGIRYGTDDYCIRTSEIEATQFLFLAGGRPRSAIYAVYRYFELFCGCRWFWDGDRIFKQRELPFAGIDITERPRFDYRGLRYFAHRSLHRFQAEHWSFEDWSAEIDWMLKKRLNLFMLRIGMDDVFQKTFPDIVSYPNRDEKLPEAGKGYDDRTLFWSLQYRGELRKKILQYAFERDLMHPEDCGTMSHWYSRTPLEFLNKVDPKLLPQCNHNYNDPTGRVWDIRDKDNFSNYFKLTETHIKEYGKPELFHTIGLGERLYSSDHEENQRMKLFVYRKICTYIKEHYPNAPLLIASWDLWILFTSEEVQELVSELDPSQSIIFDYTSDTTRKSNFTNWGITNKFPWVFGIFSGYEPNSEIRGFYDLTNERLSLAKSDPMCKGLVFWPELSHGDPFVIEYFTHNAWENDTPDIPNQIKRYCNDRYTEDLKNHMTKIWLAFMPIVQLTAWSIDETYYQSGNDIFPRIIRKADFIKENAEDYHSKFEKAASIKNNASKVLRMLSKISTTDEMTRRDIYDIARTVIGRYINAAILQAEYLYATDAETEKIEKTMMIGESLLENLSELLGSHDDYSLFASLERIKSVTETNPHFEETLKRNAECTYCRSYIYENAKYLYLPEMKLLFSEVRKAIRSGGSIDMPTIDKGISEIQDKFFSTPLIDMKKDVASYKETVIRAAELIDELNFNDK